MENTATTPPKQYTIGGQKIDDFFGQRYDSLTRWCHKKWNGNGGDVLHEAYELARERGYTHINFSLFSRLAAEAARNLGLKQWTHDADTTIILPPTERASERLAAHLATAPSDEQPNFPADCIRAAKKLIRAEKKGQPNLWSGVAV